jgi:hypothetical protein
MKDEARALAAELNRGYYEHCGLAADMLVKLVDELEHMEQQFDLAINFLAKCNNMTKDKK